MLNFFLFPIHLGEGSKPLFDRDDITVNQATIESRDTNTTHDTNTSGKSKTNRRSLSSVRKFNFSKFKFLLLKKCINCI